MNRATTDNPYARGSSLTILILLLIVVALVHFDLHSDAHLNYNPSAVVLWRQPPAADEKFSYPVADNYWHFDYTQIEKVLWGSRIDDSGDLLINSETADLLARVIALLPEEVSAKNRQRLAFLVAKSRPMDGGEQLGEYLNSYYLYQQEYRSYLSAIHSADGDKKMALLRASTNRIRQSQQKYFGPVTADKLFSEQNRITDYLNHRRIVNLDQKLTPLQKQERLSALQERYKNKVSATLKRPQHE